MFIIVDPVTRKVLRQIQEMSTTYETNSFVMPFESVVDFDVETEFLSCRRCINKLMEDQGINNFYKIIN